MKEYTQSLGEGIEFVSIVEPKFKTTNISAVLLLPCQPEKFAEWALIPNLLLNSCEKYPTIAQMSEKLQELYGAYLDNSISLIADTWQMRLLVNVIGDDYALEGEKLRQEAASLLLECILHPNLEHEKNAFAESAFRTEQQELLDVIQNEINNKRSYAVKQARKTIFQNEPNACPLYGTTEEVMALKSENVYQAYQEILKRAQILIYYVGSEEAPELPELFRNAFAERKAPEISVQNPSPCKAEPVTVSDSMNIGQCQLIMAFKADQVQQEAARMCSLMFGGAPFSLLFSNVREKMSLCYYCSSNIVYGKNTMIVASGVAQENLEKARDEILNQLEIMQKGQFEDSLLTDARRYLINALRLTGDTPSSCASEAFERFLRSDHAGVEERIRLYENLTKQDIIDTAKSFKLDTVYMLTQKGAEQA